MLPLIITLIALLISLYSVLFEKDKKENKNLKNRIEKLEMTLKNKNLANIVFQNLNQSNFIQLFNHI